MGSICPWVHTPWPTTQPALVKTATALLVAGLAESSRNTYQSGLNSYFTFCAAQGVQAIPAQSATVIMWMAAEFERKIAFTTIKTYKAAISSVHTDFGLPCPFRGDPQVARVWRGIALT